MTPHVCTQEEKIDKFLNRLMSRVQWTLGICVAFVLTLVIVVTETKVKAAETANTTKSILNDYTPLFVVEGITGSNDKLIEVIQAIPNTDKEDPRYLEAIRNRNNFQAQILKEIALRRRSTEISHNLSDRQAGGTQ